jgi:hypothetical protein
VPNVSHPSGEQSADHGAHARGGVQEAESRRPDAERLLGEHREERARHAEDHGVDVDQERRLQHPASLQISESFPNGPQDGGSRAIVLGGHRAHQRERPDRREERDGVDRVGRCQAQPGDDHASERRPRDVIHLEAQLVQRDGGGDALLRHQAGDRGRPGRRVQRGERGRDPGGQVEEPERGIACDGPSDEHQRGGHRADLADQEKLPSVHRVREGATDQRERDEGPDLRQADQTDREGRVRELVDLERQRDDRDVPSGV